MSDMPTQRQQNDLEDAAACGPVTHDEARAILTRFTNSHFKNPGEHARISIPADPRRDDDLRMAAYIVQCRNLSTENAELRRRLGEAEKVCSSVEWSGRRYDVDGQTGYESSCPWCGGWELDQDDPKSGHAPDCALAKVIRDAGGGLEHERGAGNTIDAGRGGGVSDDTIYKPNGEPCREWEHSQQAAWALGVSESWLKKQAKAGNLSHRFMGKMMFFHVHTLRRELLNSPGHKHARPEPNP